MYWTEYFETLQDRYYQRIINGIERSVETTRDKEYIFLLVYSFYNAMYELNKHKRLMWNLNIPPLTQSILFSHYHQCHIIKLSQLIKLENLVKFVFPVFRINH